MYKGQLWLNVHSLHRIKIKKERRKERSEYCSISLYCCQLVHSIKNVVSYVFRQIKNKNKQLFHKLPSYLHKTFKKASTLLHPAALQALQMCFPLLSDFTLVYVRSPLGPSCILVLGTMLVTSPPLSFNIQAICGLSAALARHDSVTLSPSSAVMLLGTIVNTGRSTWK